MLTTAEKGNPIASRIKGRPALTKRLRLLLIAVHRFGTRRARSASDTMWAARMIDTLTVSLEVATGERQPVTEQESNT